MINQNFDENVNNVDGGEKKDPGANSPVVNSDPIDDTTPVKAVLIPETPMEANAAAVGLMDETVVPEAPKGQAVTHETPVQTKAGSLALLSVQESEQLHTRWNEIQGMFVDEPRTAVQQADALVSEVLEKIIRMFAKEHSELEGQWNQGVDVSTEDLRKALQHYRAFFNRLVV